MPDAGGSTPTQQNNKEQAVQLDRVKAPGRAQKERTGQTPAADQKSPRKGTKATEGTPARSGSEKPRKAPERAAQATAGQKPGKLYKAPGKAKNESQNGRKVDKLKLTHTTPRFTVKATTAAAKKARKPRKDPGQGKPHKRQQKPRTGEIQSHSKKESTAAKAAGQMQRKTAPERQSDSGQCSRITAKRERAQSAHTAF